ncbi:MAG: hypothetical protein RIB45_12475 [Marivibrio sp.]|uniref:hypothetical protein n=1 Tax=Marivibrio sp. TaxID=2039719 RepID=UPI0032EAEAD6
MLDLWAEERYEEALMIARRLVDEPGYWCAAAALATAHSQGLGGTERDLGQAERLHRRAAASGALTARYDLARFLLNQRQGEAAARREAVTLLADLAQARYAAAMLLLARFDPSELPPNARRDRPVLWIEEAARIGHPTALFMVGSFQYAPGYRGSAPGPRAAFERAARGGQPMAALELAHGIRDGRLAGEGSESLAWAARTEAMIVRGGVLYGEDLLDRERLAARAAAFLDEAPPESAAAARADARRWVEDEMSVWPTEETLPCPAR